MKINFKRLQLASTHSAKDHTHHRLFLFLEALCPFPTLEHDLLAAIGLTASHPGARHRFAHTRDPHMRGRAIRTAAASPVLSLMVAAVKLTNLFFNQSTNRRTVNGKCPGKHPPVQPAWSRGRLPGMDAKTDTSKRRNNARKRFSPQERQRLIEKYEKSGRTQRAFAEEHGIGVSTFLAWLSEKRKRAAGDAKKPEQRWESFSLPLNASTTSWELTLPNGICVRAPVGAGAEELARLIAQLERRR